VAVHREHCAGPAARLELRFIGPDPGFAVVFLQGEFDIETVPEIDRFLRRSFGPFFFKRHIGLDLHGVTLIDSAFVGFVVDLARQLRSERQELILARPVGQARRVLALVGLPNLIPVYDSLEEAAEAVARGSLPIIPPAFALQPGTSATARASSVKSGLRRVPRAGRHRVEAAPLRDTLARGVH